MSSTTPRFGLIGRLTVAAAITGAVIGLAGMFVVDRYATIALRDRVEEGNRGLAERLAVSFDDRIERTVSMLRFAATDEDLASLDRVAATTDLTAALRASRDWDAITVYDRAGRAVASAAARVLADPASMPRRKEMVDEVASSGSAVRIRAGRIPGLEIAAPVESPPGRVVGALIAEIPFETIGTFITAFRLGASGAASLVDLDGVTLLHRDRSRVVQERRLQLSVRAAAPVSAVRRTREGVMVLTAAAQMQSFPGAVVIEQDLADATEPITGARRMLILIVLLSVAATAGVISIAGRRVLSPIHPLILAVRRLGSGDRSARAPAPARNDEIGLLSEHFNRMAQAVEGLDRAKSEFVANAAHELRTPLTAVSGLTEVLRERDTLTPEELTEVCAALERQGTRARLLVERMLDLLRIESGAIVVSRHAVNVEEVIRAALIATPAPSDRTVTIDVEPSLVVMGDPVALEQVISNLLTNAYRYGGASISIVGARADGTVRITFEDDGPGVTPAAMEHLFEPFNRGPEAMGVGSGLGLAIVRRTLASMEGSIRYEARDPQGARFVIELVPVDA